MYTGLRTRNEVSSSGDLARSMEGLSNLKLRYNEVLHRSGIKVTKAESVPQSVIHFSTQRKTQLRNIEVKERPKFESPVVVKRPSCDYDECQDIRAKFLKLLVKSVVKKLDKKSKRDSFELWKSFRPRSERQYYSVKLLSEILYQN